jgi:preprotein translocase subunit SecD
MNPEPGSVTTSPDSPASAKERKGWRTGAIVAATAVAALVVGLIFGLPDWARRPAVSVLLQYDLSRLKPKDHDAAWRLTLGDVRQRARQMGDDCRISEVGNDRLRVQLFGKVKANPADAGRILTGPRLVFRLLHPDLARLANPPPTAAVPPGYEAMEMLVEDASRKPMTVYCAVKRVPEMTDENISYATPEKTGEGRFQVLIHFNKAGAEQFAEVTAANVNRQLGIVLDGKLYSAPRIMDRISSGAAVITGNFTQREAIELSNVFTNPVQLHLPAKVVVEDGGTDTSSGDPPETHP